MSVKFEYDSEQQLLMLTFEGELRDEDLVQAFRRTQKHARHMTVRRGIMNGLGITESAVTAERVKSLAHHAPMFPADSDRAIVIKQDFLYGLARMYQMLAGESREKLRVVRTMAEAYEHLRIHAPKKLETIAE